MRRTLLFISLLFISLCITAYSGNRLLIDHRSLPRAEEYEAGGLYLPQKNIVTFLSFGYQTAVSDLLWFNLNNYFGKHYRSDRKYTWFKHMCELVISLDERAPHVYEFCALMLAWEANSYKDANDILSLGMENLPENWRFYFMKGLNYRIFEGDNEKAMKEFAKGAEIPGSPSYLKTMATKLMTNIDGPHAAVSFLRQTISNTKDETQRKVLEEQLQRTIHTIAIHDIEQHCKKIEEETGKKPATLKECRLKPLRDPAGGHYYLNKETGEVETTSSLKPIPLFTEHLKEKIKPLHERNSH